MSNTTSRVAALVPAYQAASFIQKTLDSLSAQSWPEFAVLVSVDQCDDDTLQICEAHAAGDARFRVFQQEQRLGWIGNTNFLLGQADADYAMFASHDDLLAPTFVSTLATALDVRPKTILAHSDALFTRLDGVEEHWAYTAMDGVSERVARAMKMLKREGHWYAPNRGMFRLAPARTIGGLKCHGAGEFAADWPWLLHLSLLGEFHRVPETLCFKYRQEGSLSRGWHYTREHWIEAGASCMREIWNADIPVKDKAALASFLLPKLCRALERPK